MPLRPRAGEASARGAARQPREPARGPRGRSRQVRSRAPRRPPTHPGPGQSPAARRLVVQASRAPAPTLGSFDGAALSLFDVLPARAKVGLGIRWQHMAEGGYLEGPPPPPYCCPYPCPYCTLPPPYCCPYPCPYCTLLPSLLLPLPVSLLYTRMMATAPPAARPPSCAPRRRRAPEPRPSTAPLYAGCRVPGGLGCPQRGGARRRRADGGRRGRGAGPREPRASSPRPDHALDWFRERTRRVVFERHALAHRPGPTQRGGPARCLAWTLHRSLSASRASQGALPPSFASLSMAPGAHGKTDPPGLSRTPIAVGPPQCGPPNDRSVVILTVGREVDGEPDLKLLDCSVEHRA